MSYIIHIQAHACMFRCTRSWFKPLPKLNQVLLVPKLNQLLLHLRSGFKYPEGI